MDNPDITRTTDDLLREYLALERSTCPVCRYEVSNLRDRCCPECGKQLRLCLQPVERHLALLIGTCAALASGLGFFAFLLITFLGLLIVHGASGGPPLWIWAFLALMTLVQGAALLVLLLRTPAFARAGRATQRTLLVISWLVTLVSTGILITMILRL